jgi:hypothetical protein
MNRQKSVAGLILAVAVVMGVTGGVLAEEQVPFKGFLDGNYTVTVIPPIGTFVGSGAGAATHLGGFTYEFPHTVNFGSVPPVGVGSYTFTAANGDAVFAVFTGQSSPVAPGFVFVVEECVITGGTGRFANASGSFTVSRLVDQVNRTTIGSFEGTISSAGAVKR